MCPQYLWIDTPHAYGRTTLNFNGVGKKVFLPVGGIFEEKKTLQPAKLLFDPPH